MERVVWLFEVGWSIEDSGLAQKCKKSAREWVSVDQSVGKVGAIRFLVAG